MNRTLDNLGYAVCVLALFAMALAGIVELGRAVGDAERAEASLPRLERVTVVASRIDGQALQPAQVAGNEGQQPATRAVR